MINLFSDTATKPTAAMREFMMSAEVGDEQLREDPSVNELQDLVADLTGKEAGLFLPSGTMCNVIAFCLHCERGDSVILDRFAHPATAEGGGPAVFANVLLKTVSDTDRGRYSANEVRPLLSSRGTHSSGTTLISIENTTNAGGGAIWSLEPLRGLRALADEQGMRLHMDGARLMNAVVASGHSAREYADIVDSLWIDLSKGLGCPVGAVLVGTTEFIERARILKHRFGGAMRQAGVIAAAGTYAFRHHVDRLTEDHANARLLEAGLREIEGVELVNGPVETNILFFRVLADDAVVASFQDELRSRGVIVSRYANSPLFRAVTHLDVSQADCETAVEVIRETVEAAR
jgi:threonine aldolase